MLCGFPCSAEQVLPPILARFRFRSIPEIRHRPRFLLCTPHGRGFAMWQAYLAGDLLSTPMPDTEVVQRLRIGSLSPLHQLCMAPNGTWLAVNEIPQFAGLCATLPQTDLLPAEWHYVDTQGLWTPKLSFTATQMIRWVQGNHFNEQTRVQTTAAAQFDPARFIPIGQTQLWRRCFPSPPLPPPPPPPPAAHVVEQKGTMVYTYWDIENCPIGHCSPGEIVRLLKQQLHRRCGVQPHEHDIKVLLPLSVHRLHHRALSATIVEKCSQILLPGVW